MSQTPVTQDPLHLAMWRIPVLVKAYEWSSDYQCVMCGATFNVADDSPEALDLRRGHTCGVAVVDGSRTE